MSATPARASLSLQRRLAAALERRLLGRPIDRLWRPTEDTLLIRVSGLSPQRVLVSAVPALPFVALTTRWPPTPARPDQTTLRFRQALEGARVRAVTVEDERALCVHLTRGDSLCQLRVQLAGRYPNAVVLDDQGEELARLLMGRPAFDPDSPALPPGPLPGELALPDDDDALLDAWADDRASARARLERSQRHAALLRTARAHLRKVERAEAAIGADHARVAEAEQHRRHGELLKTALHRVPRGADAIMVTDHAQPDAPEVLVPLDPALDARANLERHFRLYRRFRDASDAILARLDEARRRRADMEQLYAHILALGQDLDAADLDVAQDDAEARLRALGWRPRAAPSPSRARTAPALPYRRFEALDGSAVLVGRSAADNDQLTFRHGRPGDLWLHARDVPGSHVLLRPPAGRDPDGEAMLDAATLAAWHSQARGETTIDVTWTERKHVRKPRGAPPGRVTLARGRTIPVRVEPERIERLYRSLEGDGAP